MKRKPGAVVEKITNLSQLRHGDRVMIMENDKKVAEGTLQGQPWASNHAKRGPGGQPRSTVAKAQESEIVHDMITLGSVLAGGARRSTSAETKDFKVIGSPRRVVVFRIVAT
jgi:hypothetical protein